MVKTNCAGICNVLHVVCVSWGGKRINDAINLFYILALRILIIYRGLIEKSIEILLELNRIAFMQLHVVLV